MAGILDLLKNIEFKPSPVGMGLLQMGANMLQNSGPSRQPVSFGQSLGAGLQGFGEGALVGGHFQNQQKKNKEAEELKKALAQIDINQPPEKLAQQLASIGMISEALPLVKPKDVNPRAGIPTGFNPTGNPGEIASQMIDLGNGEKIPYLDYQMMLWNQKQQTPSYGEPERLDMAREDQGLQRAQFALSQENAARAAAQAAESNRLANEKFSYEKDKEFRPKPLPPSVVRQQNDELDALGTATGLNTQLKHFENLIEKGKLSLGPVDNLLSKGKLATGLSDENARNYGDFIATLEKLRNDTLRLNKGVQTEGDAQRAWNEILTHPNDEDYVKERLKLIQGYNDAAAKIRKLNVDTMRDNYNQPAFDFTPYEKITRHPEDASQKTPKRRATDKPSQDVWSIKLVE